MKDRNGELIEVERDAHGQVMICTGCGTVEKRASILRRRPCARSCCPERKMMLAVPQEEVERLTVCVAEQAAAIDDLTVRRDRHAGLVARITRNLGQHREDNRRLRKLVEAAYREGFRDAGRYCHCDCVDDQLADWPNSDARKALEVSE